MPDFQREGNLWNDTQKSQLIESILLGLPLPSFYFSDDFKATKWQIVDGLQRLSTLKAFWINKELVLEGLEFLTKFNGCNFDDLSRADLRSISGFKINIYIIDKQTPKATKFLIFKRLNTGGLVLTSQEMRNALNQGVASEFIKELSLLESFKKATDYKIPTKRQEDRDFINRFVAFYLLGFEKHYNGELDSFLNEAMGLLEKTTVETREKLKRDFEFAMNISYDIFGNDAFRKRSNLDESRRPISKAVYDSVSINIALLTPKEREVLKNKKENFRLGLIDLFNNDVKFHKSITTATGQKSNVVERFSKIKNLLKSILQQ